MEAGVVLRHNTWASQLAAHVAAAARLLARIDGRGLLRHARLRLLVGPGCFLASGVTLTALGRVRMLLRQG